MNQLTCINDYQQIIAQNIHYLNNNLVKLRTGLSAIIVPFSVLDNIMEAEQLNALAHQLQDLRVRITELRRYL